MDTEIGESISLEQPKKRAYVRKILFWLGGGVLLLSLVILAFLWWQLQAPSTSQEVGDITVVIEPGQTISSIANEVAAAGVVKNADLLYLTLQLRYREAPIKAGTYTLEPAHTLTTADALVNTTPADELVRLTLPEGMRARDFASLAANVLGDFAIAEYIEFGTKQEGYLWPETYFIPVDFTAPDLLELQIASAQEVLENNQVLITESPLSEYEVITLASIVEREANTPESMGMVAGILLNRIAIGMALQADASIEYVLETPLGALPPGVLASELRERDSPYNTYLNTGLPPTPIGNPGEQAIRAVLEPIDSDYLFYITGNDGMFYYAETFDQHRLNISRHLR